MTQKKPLLQDLSEKPGHNEGESLYQVKTHDGRIAKKRAHTAREAWTKARLELGDPGYNECTFEIIPEGVEEEATPEVPKNGKAHELSHASALARIVVLETMVSQLQEKNRKLQLVVDSRVRTGVPGLGEQRSKSSPRALEKLIPKKKAKRGKTTSSRAAKRKSPRRASRT
jgi:hypothetical protein